MSEEGIDDVVDRGLRQLLAAGGQIAESVARLRQELLRRQQQTIERTGQEYVRTVATDRANMRAVLAPVNEKEWWNRASAEQVAGAYQAAEAWKDYDPVALVASTKIRDEVKTRYGIDTNDVQGDREFLRDTVNVQQQAGASVEELRKHTEAMELLAAAQAAALREDAKALRNDMDRLQVPEEYRVDPVLLEALEGAGGARTDAERLVAERIHLIKEDGPQGPTIEQLREEVTSNYSGADESLFQDAAFVMAAKDWHEARVLAEGGFVDQDNGLEARYKASEKELFDRVASLGHDIENGVLKDQPTTPSPPERQSTREQSPAYGSGEHRTAFAQKLEGTGTPEEIHVRLVAAADQGSHPREATRQNVKVPPKPRRAPTTSSAREVSKGGPTR